MRRHVLVLWEGDPIATCTIEGARAVRIGPEPDSDVVLPVQPATIEKDGETALGPFAVRLTTTDDVALPRAPRALDSSLAYTALSAVAHATILGALALVAYVHPTDPGADEASRLAAMRGYVARIEDRGTSTEASPPERRSAHFTIDESADAFDATPILAPPPALVNAKESAPPPQIARIGGRHSIARRTSGSHDGYVGAPYAPHVDTGSAGASVSGTEGLDARTALRKGEHWSGTYLCAQGLTAVVLRVDSVQGDDVTGVFDFTHAPTQVHGSFRMHGRVDHETGEATLLPDEWIERPANYMTVGMHGHVDGKRFDGVITNETCGMFTLHRPT